LIVKENFFYVESNRLTQFTDALVQYASEYETIAIHQTGPNKTYLTSLTLTTATNHAFTIMVKSRSGSPDQLAATPYKSSVIDYWKFDTTDALAQGTQWIYAVTGMKIPVIDEEGTGSLHLGLVNESSQTKAALGTTSPAGTGIQFGYIHLRAGLISEA